MTEEQNFGKVHGVLIMTLLEMLQFLVLIIVQYPILMIKENNCLVLSEGPTDGNIDNTRLGTKSILTLLKQM